MKITTSKPKMLRVMNTSLLGGLLSSSNIEVNISSMICYDKSLQTVISWAKFDGAYFDSFYCISSDAPTGSAKITVTESMLKAMKSIQSSDIELSKNDGVFNIKGSSFKYSESEQTSTGTSFSIDQEIMRPDAVEEKEILVSFDIDIEELRKLPSADKYTFVVSKNSFKVITENVGTLEIDLKFHSIANAPFSDYKKSFSGDIFEKIISNLDGKVHVEFGDKFLIISSVTPEVKLMFAQASLVDSTTVTV
tara:strand:+ start:126 stop:875 length:750 start_codon:yes stop_codon:yes gene_type:complete